jgi:hypothetical protein
VKVSNFLKSIEKWASESDDRARLLVILIWAGFGLLVLIAIAMTTLLTIPPPAKPL